MHPRHRKILTLLKSKPLSTLDIASRFRLRQRIWIHTDLWHLEDQKLITGYFDEAFIQERAGLRRRFYYLTQKGKAALEE